MVERNVTEAELASYIQTFHETLASSADRFLPQDTLRRLKHGSLLPAEIICYVSTKFGVAFEYKRASETTIRTVRGSARIEDLLVGAPHRVRATGPMFAIGGRETGIFSLTLDGAFPFRLTDPQADVAIGDVRFRVGSWSRVVEYADVFGDRRASRWTEATAVARANEEVLAATVELRRAREREVSLDEYIAQHKAKTVLLLGSYDETGLERLRSLETELKALGYEPVLLEDVPDNPYQDLAQKVATLGNIARFVVVDDSEKSGHLAELEICKANRWVTAILRRGGKGSSWMTAGVSVFSKVIREAAYEPPPMSEAVRESAEWAEATVGEVKKELANTYPWRAAKPPADEISGDAQE